MERSGVDGTETMPLEIVGTWVGGDNSKVL